MNILSNDKSMMDTDSNLSSSSVCWKKVAIPKGLPALLEIFAKEAIRENPENIHEFLYNLAASLLAKREDEEQLEQKKSKSDQENDNKTKADEENQNSEELAAAKIQAGFRGYQTRKSLKKSKKKGGDEQLASSPSEFLKTINEWEENEVQEEENKKEDADLGSTDFDTKALLETIKEESVESRSISAVTLVSEETLHKINTSHVEATPANVLLLSDIEDEIMQIQIQAFAETGNEGEEANLETIEEENMPQTLNEVLPIVEDAEDVVAEIEEELAEIMTPETLCTSAFIANDPQDDDDLSENDKNTTSEENTIGSCEQETAILTEDQNKTETDLENSSNDKVENDDENVETKSEDDKLEENSEDNPGISEELAATKIQANFRGYQTRKSLKKSKKESEEETEKVETAENEENNEDTSGISEELAATKIQANFRGYQTRKSLKKFKKESEETEKDETAENEENNENTSDIAEKLAATKIQANFRGYQTRKSLKKSKKESEEETEKEENNEDTSGISEELAATKIQANFRGYQTRKSLKKSKKESEEETEKVETAENEENNENTPDIAEELAATKIQANFRGYQTRKSLQKSKNESEEETDKDKEQDDTNVESGEKESDPCAENDLEDSTAADITEESSPILDNVTEEKAPSVNNDENEGENIQTPQPDDEDDTVEIVAAATEENDLPDENAEKTNEDTPDFSEELAATKIQANFRGYQARKSLKKSKKESEEETENEKEQDDTNAEPEDKIEKEENDEKVASDTTDANDECNQPEASVEVVESTVETVVVQESSVVDTVSNGIPEEESLNEEVSKQDEKEVDELDIASTTDAQQENDEQPKESTQADIEKEVEMTKEDAKEDVKKVDSLLIADDDIQFIDDDTETHESFSDTKNDTCATNGLNDDSQISNHVLTNESFNSASPVTKKDDTNNSQEVVVATATVTTESPSPIPVARPRGSSTRTPTPTETTPLITTKEEETVETVEESPVLRRDNSSRSRRSRAASSKYRSGIVMEDAVSLDEMEAQIENEVLNEAATKIQAGFRGFQTRKSLHVRTGVSGTEKESESDVASEPQTNNLAEAEPIPIEPSKSPASGDVAVNAFADNEPNVDASAEKEPIAADSTVENEHMAEETVSSDPPAEDDANVENTIPDSAEIKADDSSASQSAVEQEQTVSPMSPTRQETTMKKTPLMFMRSRSFPGSAEEDVPEEFEDEFNDNMMDIATMGAEVEGDENDNIELELDEGYINNAATKIQANIRGFLVRKKMKRNGRRRHTTGETGSMEDITDEVAATVEAANNRTNVAGEPTDNTEDADESGVEGDEVDEASQLAATKIQAGFRGFKDRQKIRQKKKAAVTIQATVRGFLTRRRLAKARRRSLQRRRSSGKSILNDIQSLQQANMAATKIQSIYRGYQVRSKMSPKMNRSTGNE